MQTSLTQCNVWQPSPCWRAHCYAWLFFLVFLGTSIFFSCFDYFSVAGLLAHIHIHIHSHNTTCSGFFFFTVAGYAKWAGLHPMQCLSASHSHIGGAILLLLSGWAGSHGRWAAGKWRKLHFPVLSSWILGGKTCHVLLWIQYSLLKLVRSKQGLSCSILTNQYICTVKAAC